MELTDLLLAKGANVNCYGPEKGPSLAIAASQGNVELVALLLGHGADVNVPCDGTSITPLQAAVQAGGIFLTRVFLEMDAEVNCPMIPCRSPSALQFAAKNLMLST
jgi:ankyrin repeat protein